MNAHCHAALNRAILRLLPEFSPESRLALVLEAQAEQKIFLDAVGPFPDFYGALIEGGARFPDMIATRGRGRDGYLSWANHHWCADPAAHDAHRLIPAGPDSVAWDLEDLPALLGPGNTGDLPWAVALYLRRIDEQTCNPLYDHRLLAFDLFSLLHFAGGDFAQVPHTSGDHGVDAAFHHRYEGEGASRLIDRLTFSAANVAPFVESEELGDVAQWFCDQMRVTASKYPEWLAAYESGGDFGDLAGLCEWSFYRAVGGGISLLMHLERTGKNPACWGG